MKVNVFLRILFAVTSLCGALDFVQALRTRAIKSPLKPDGSWEHWNKCFKIRKDMNLEQTMSFLKDCEKALVKTIKNVSKEHFNNVLIRGLKDLGFVCPLSNKMRSNIFLKNFDYNILLIVNFLWNSAVHSHQSFDDGDRQSYCAEYLEHCGSTITLKDLEGATYDADFVNKLLEKCSEKIKNKRCNQNTVSRFKTFKDVILFAKTLMDECAAKRDLYSCEILKPEEADNLQKESTASSQERAEQEAKGTAVRKRDDKVRQKESSALDKESVTLDK